MRLLRPGDVDDFSARFGDDADTVRLRLADYMARSPVLYTLVSRPVGEVDLPSTIYCDGDWLWWETAVEATREGTVPERAFVDHVLVTTNPSRALTEDQIASAFEYLEAYSPS